MKKVALFVLVLTAAVIADDDKDMEDVAKTFETDKETIQICLNDAEMKIADVTASLQMMRDIKDDAITDEIKQSLMKYKGFLACMLEKDDMMIDTKLVVDKIYEKLGKDKDVKSLNKEVLMECLTSMNEDGEMTREDRAFGLLLCIMSSQIDGNRK